MTITTVYRDGRPVAIDLDTTVSYSLPGDATQNMPPYRDGVRPPRLPDVTDEQPPYTASWSFGSVVDQPTPTEDLPPFAAYANRGREHVGRHRQRRTWRTVLAAALFRLAAAISRPRGRRDGV